MKRIEINERVVVTAIGFRKNLESYPRRIEFRGQTYNFIDAGIRCLVRRGSVIAEIITLTDGIANYLLKTDNIHGGWMLLGIVN